MEILQSYEFKRPSNSRYAAAVKALVEDGVFAVKLKRGEDFPDGVKIENVQGAVSTQIRAAGKRAHTFAESKDVLVVALYGENEGPKPRRKRAARQTASAL